MSTHYTVKQVVLVPRDLRTADGHKVRTGKLMAQAGHAAMAWLGSRFRNAAHGAAVDGYYSICLTNAEEDWLVHGAFAKIVLGVENEVDLHNLVAEARIKFLPAEVITDAGHTEFRGVPTVTCAAIGPGPSDLIDQITGHLKPF